MKNKKTNKKLMSTVAVASAFAVVVGGAFAFFIDTANFTKDVNVGTVNIDVQGDLVHSDTLNNLNPGDNDPEIPTDARPGTDHELSFEISNLGNKSVITRTVIEVSGLRKDGKTVFTEEELINIILSEKANVTALTTNETIADTDANKQTEVVRLTPTGYSDNKLVYVVGGSRGNQDALNGTGNNAEIEDGVTIDKLIKTFDVGLAMDSDSELYSSGTITIRVKVEAMQYRNTGNEDWEVVFDKSFTTGGTPVILPSKLLAGSDFAKAIPAGTTEIIFTDVTKPENVEIVDLSIAQNESIVGWSEGTTFKISTQVAGNKVVANPDCSSMFAAISSLQSVDFTGLDVSKVTDMSSMFEGDNGLKSVNMPEGFDTSNVTNMEAMFSGTAQLKTLILPSSFNTVKVTNMKSMFASMQWTKLVLPESFNSSNADTSDMFRSYRSASGSLTVGSKFKFTGNGTFNANSYPCGMSGNWFDGAQEFLYTSLPDNVAATYTIKQF